MLIDPDTLAEISGRSLDIPPPYDEQRVAEMQLDILALLGEVERLQKLDSGSRLIDFAKLGREGVMTEDEKEDEKEVVGIITRTLTPWNEEVQGVKFAAHDARLMAKATISALKAAGYVVEKEERMR